MIYILSYIDNDLYFVLSRKKRKKNPYFSTIIPLFPGLQVTNISMLLKN